MVGSSRTKNGVEPVKDWMTKDLSFEDRKIILEGVATLQRGFPNVNMPLVRPMGQGLYELRCHITGKRIQSSINFRNTPATSSHFVVGRQYS